MIFMIGLGNIQFKRGMTKIIITITTIVYQLQARILSVRRPKILKRGIEGW